jgi:hypothetical protein
MRTTRETHIHMARVFIAAARANRHHPAWHATLMKWAAQRRTRAARWLKPGQQGELF